MLWKGVALSLLAAVCHSIVDGLRKSGSSHVSTTALVGLVAVLDAILGCSGVAVAGGFRGVRFADPHTFAAAVLTSSGLLLYSKFLYQQALATSHLSLTVPFLSFTPTFLVVTAFVFLGEVPSQSGLMGVAIVTAGGYFLSRVNTSSSVGSSGAAGVPSGGTTRVEGGSGKLLGDTSKPATPSGSSNGLSSLYVVPGGGVIIERAVYRTVSNGGSLSVDAGGNPGDVVLEMKVGGTSPRTQEGDDSDSGAHAYAAAHHTDRLVARVASRIAWRAGSQPGAVPGGPLPVYHTAPGSADKGSDGKGHAGLQGGGSQGSAWHGSHWGSGSVLALLLAPARCFARQETGTVLMVCVAAMWSVTASLDKLGILHAPSVWVYFAAQRFVIGLAAAGYLLMHAPHVFALLRTRWLFLLLAISVAELSAVVFFLEAIKFIFVSYVVAIKRCNILLSVLIGAALFKERILTRLPYIFVMLLGVLLIVLEPHAAFTHHTTHT